MEPARRCSCHGVAMYPNTNGWRCAVRVRERQRPGDLVYWHRQDGGYIRRRKRDLARQRIDIQERIDQLEHREAA